MLGLGPRGTIATVWSILMSRYIDSYMRLIYRMDEWEWFLVLLAVLCMGIFCMRGFGSRTDY